MSQVTEETAFAAIAERYTAVWSLPNPQERRDAVAGLWAPDGIEFIEGAQFRGHQELYPRITEAYERFMGSGEFTITCADDVMGHHGAVTFTIQFITNTGDNAGEIAWIARVFLVLDKDGLIERDYHFTVKPLAQ
ncbi:hypothetical protein [Actinomadura roseirufa]|uniref:hypothetical protein n=1 Tax=Actinomadura roseirufa TaxID=2094049 RepID=UPI001041AB3B|nr:hypothetical protein [Actinomadura roseirufa]